MRATTYFAAVMLTVVASSASAQNNDVMTNGAFSYGSGQGSFATGHDERAGSFHKNPWKHTVVHHKTAEEYHKDPWIARNSIAGKDNSRDGWYSPYQQFSPPQLQYQPSVSEATFATCRLGGRNSQARFGAIVGDEIQFAQMKGKSMVVKRQFCNSGRNWGNTPNITFRVRTMMIMEYGKVEDDVDGNVCTFVGEEFNPLSEVDQSGRANPFQDPNRGTMPDFTAQRNDGDEYPTCDARDVFGYEDLEPFTLLQNLDGAESIMGRAVRITRVFNQEIETCCIIARQEAPDGYGPKPVPFPLTTLRETYNSYGTNQAVPLPYHKHGYQATADVDNWAGKTNMAAALVDQYLN